jgi:hypothetical protein
MLLHSRRCLAWLALNSIKVHLQSTVGPEICDERVVAAFLDQVQITFVEHEIVERLPAMSPGVAFVLVPHELAVH